MTPPTVSVYLPTRNRSSLVVEAARSVLNQTFRDLELVIADDASDDDTPQTLARLAESDSRVRIVRSSRRLGPSAIRNLAVDVARGHLITGIDDDDLMLPRRIDDLVRAAARYDSLICTGFYVERNGRRRALNVPRRTITLDALFHFNYIGNQALLQRRKFIELGGFDENLSASEDYDLWTRAVDRYGPGLRIRSVSYVKRELPMASQITGTSIFALGAAQYAAKYHQRMSAAQRRSQRLICKIASGTQILPGEIPGLLAIQTAPVFFKQFVKQIFFGPK